MTISLKHTFVSAVPDGSDPNQVQPSNWNEEHVLTMATSRLLGRTTAGTGAAEEISVGSGLSLSGGVLDTVEAQNLFRTIAVSGQSDIVADSTTDTLTVAAGTGITLTTNATTDTLTIAVTGSTYQPLDATLTSLAAYNTNGLLTQTAADTFTGRTLTGPAAGITVSNGNGVSGNPTLALANDLAAVEGLASTGIVRRTGTDTWSAGTTVSTAEIADGAVTYAKIGSGVVRELLSAARTYYVRTDGSDSNTGLANTSGGAFLTIGKALTVAASLDCSIYNCTIEVAAGTFAENVTLPRMTGSGTFTLNGVGSTSIIEPSSGVAVSASSNATAWVLSNVKLDTTNANCLSVQGGGTAVIINTVEFGSAGTGSHIVTSFAGRVSCSGNYSMTGGALYHVACASGGIFSGFGRTITLTGTPAFSTAFAGANTLGFINFGSATFSGSATGPRYEILTGGVINTGGGGASFLPGNSAGSGGTTSGGGFYV